MRIRSSHSGNTSLVLSSAAALAVALVVGPMGNSTAQAAAYSWDPSMTPATPSGGTGTWDLTNVFWSDGTNDFIWPNTATTTATFGGTAGTVTLGAPLQANALTFSTAGYTLTASAGGSLAMVGTTPTITTTADATINAPVSGTAGLTKAGAGKLTLGGANTYTGNTSLTAGTLALASGASLASTSSLVLNGAATLDLGGNSQSLASLTFGTSTSAFTSTLTNGSLSVSNANNLTIGGFNNAAGSTSKLDASGLSAFNITLAAGKQLLFTNQSAGGVSPAASTIVSLGNTNTLTASTIQVGNGQGATTSSAPFHIGQLELGQTNTLNADSLLIGAYRGNGLINFRAGQTGATATLRGFAGGSTPMNLLQVAVNQNGAVTSSSLDLSGGSVDAIVNTVIVSQSNSGGANASGTLTLGGGTATIGTLILSNSISTNTTVNANVLSTVNHNSGTVLVSALNFTLRNPPSGGTTDNLSGTYNLGSNGATPTSATLSAGTIGFGTGTIASNARETLNFNNGVITNYNPALGQAGASVATGGSATPQNLVISGTTGGGAGNNNNTLTINLPAAGTHTLRANDGRSITVNSTALITGAGGLTLDGPGQVNLLGSQGYAGATTVQAGTLKAATPAYTSLLANAGGIDLQGGRVTLDYGAGTSPVAQVKTILEGGYAANFANGQIRSTILAANRTLGYGDDGAGNVNVIITLPGDANLDGSVNFNDFLILQNNFSAPGTRFDQGNFNYDAQTDFNDFLVLQNNFGQSVTGAAVSISPAEFAAVAAFASSQVPEPGSLAVLGLSAGLLLRRRK